MARTKYLAFFLLLIAFAACNRASQQESQVQPPPEQPAAQQAEAQPAAQPQAAAPVSEPSAEKTAAPAASKTKSTSAVRPSPAGGAPGAGPAAPSGGENVQGGAAPTKALRPAETVAAAPVPVRPTFATVPSGNRFEIRLADPLDSSKNKPGDKFQSTLDQDLVVDGKVVAPRGSPVSGKVVTAVISGRVKGRASMSITLTEIQIKDASYPLQTNTLSFEAQGTEKTDALKVGGGAGLGAIIGAIAGGKRGAAIGAAVGGGAGTATVLGTRGKEVKFGPEERFSFALENDLQIRIQ